MVVFRLTFLLQMFSELCFCYLNCQAYETIKGLSCLQVVLLSRFGRLYSYLHGSFAQLDLFLGAISVLAWQCVLSRTEFRM